MCYFFRALSYSFVGTTDLIQSILSSGGIMGKDKIIRVMVAKPGLDGHDRGAKVISRALRDAGMEVIYTGLRQTPEQIVTAALQEDVDALLLSILSGAHNHLFPKVMQLLKEKGGADILVIGGGVIPQDDIPGLKNAGIKEVFGPGTSTEMIANYIKENAC
jgi:methylmalonyl-CoA mutase C-terminal domain/subunit